MSFKRPAPIVLLAVALVTTMLTACQSENYAGKANVIEKPADTIRTVAVFRTRCSDVRGACAEAGSMESLRAAIAEDLEFRGIRIVREEELFQRARDRTQTSGGVDLPILGPILASSTTLEGSTFDDIPPNERETLLKLAGVDGVVESRIALEEGHVKTLSDYRDATLQIRMGLRPDGQTTSVHRCTWTYAAGLKSAGGAERFPGTVKTGVACALESK